MTDVTRALAHLADRVLVHRSAGLEPYVAHTLKLALQELELHIPGLEAPPNADAAKAFMQAAETSLSRGDERDALAYALRGLSCSPHDPALHYLAASACIELGGVETALRLLYHTLWIHPGHANARRDLEALRAFLEGDEADDRDDRAA
jgi:tetratricopeptide (TPR) repeat protein